MGLRKGNVRVDQAAAAAETPAPAEFDAGQQASPVVAEVPAPAAAPAPAPAPAPVVSAPLEQEAAAVVASTAVVSSPAPVGNVAEAPMQPPATRTVGTTPMVPSGVQADLENDGFAGLDFGFGSFPVVSLQNTGQFESSEGGSLGNDFYATILGSVPKWIYKNDQKGPAEEFFYTFDRQFSMAGEPIEDILLKWKGKGWKHEVKKYLDVQAQMVTQDEDNGTLVLLSIPPTSITKLSGYMATVKGRHGKKVQEVVTHITLGEKVTKTQYPFHPWAFTYHSDV